MHVSCHSSITGYVLTEFIRQTANLLRIGKQFTSAIRQGQRVVDTLKQQAIQLCFQLLDLE